MESGQLSREEALACAGYKHACHVMLYSDTKSQLFGKTPIKHIVLVSSICVALYACVCTVQREILVRSCACVMETPHISEHLSV